MALYKSTIEEMAQSDFENYSGNLGGLINTYTTSEDSVISNELIDILNNWNEDITPEGWRDLVDWIWEKIIDFAEWLWDLLT